MAIRFHDWRDTNARRKYPFADYVPAASDELTIPDELFVDGRLYPIGGNEQLYLSRITKDANALTFAIRATGTDELATASFSLDDIPSTGEVAFFDEYSRPAGILISSETALQTFSGIDVGVYEFLLSQTEFAAAVNTPQPAAGVRGFVLPDGDMVTGNVWLVGEDGVVLRRDSDNALRVDVIGDPYAARKLCADEEANEDIAALRPYCPIKTLNGIAPDAKANFQMLVGSNQSMSPILRIIPGEQSGSDVTEHLEGESSLNFATVIIEMLGERRFRGA
jgi:hypothetical protein